MVTEVSPLQYSKADSPMDVTLLGIIVFEHPFIKVLVAVSIMALQLSRESYFGLPLSTLIDVKPLQPKKALSPMDVTLPGMVRDVRPLQPEKACSPIDVTLPGMVRDVRPLQPQKDRKSVV